MFGNSLMWWRGRSGRGFLRAASASLAAGLVATMLGSPVTAAAAAATPHLVAATVAGNLSGVACPGSSCMAVGGRSPTAGHGGGTLAERWNGTKWSVVTSPNPSGSDGARLNAISCTSTNSCVAVGQYNNSAHTATLPTAEKWNGSKWSVLTVPAPSGTTNAALDGVSCASATSCQAVGSSADNTLAEGWNGTKWSIEPSLSPKPSKPEVLSGVACVPASGCWAVGFDFPTNFTGSLTEKWNGSKWSVVSTPTSKSGELAGDACSGTSDCLSAGIGNKLFAIGQVWNGSKWATATPKKPAGATDSELNGVSCPGGSACEAGGNYDTASGAIPLAEGWTGTTWAVQATPSISGSTYASFQGMACTKASNCWAVGETISSSATDPLIERWNGKSWSVTAS